MKNQDTILNDSSNDNPPKMECYVKYLDSQNKYKEATKDFESYSKAWEWILKTFDHPSKDYIYYY